MTASVANPVRSRFFPGLLLALGFGAVSVLALHQYRFGVWDQTLILPMFKHALDPTLYRGDYLLSVIPHYHTLFWAALAGAVDLTGVDVGTLFFCVYCLAAVATLLGIGAVSFAVFAEPRGAALAMLLFLFSKRLPGGTFSLDEILYTRTAALPLLLFSLAALLRGRPLAAACAAGGAFLIHPLSAAAFLIPMAAAAPAVLKRRRPAALLAAAAVFAVAAAPLLIRYFRNYAASPVPLPAWLEVLRIRSSHHIFPFSWDPSVYFEALLVLGTLAVSWPSALSDGLRRFFRTMLVAVAVLVLLGVFFTEIVPVRLAVHLQLFRAFKPLYCIALIFFAEFFVRAVDAAGGWRGVLLPVFAGMALLYGAFHWREAVVLLAALAGFARYSRSRGAALSPGRWSAALCALAVLAGVRAWAEEGGDFKIGNAQRPQWLAVQRWAREATPQDAVFIVPPTWSHEGFRVESERAVYGDWKDGTLANWDPAFGAEWLRRMRSLGFSGEGSLEADFRRLGEIEFKAVARRLRAQGSGSVYLVGFADDNLPFPLAYRNPAYVVYRLE